MFCQVYNELLLLYTPYGMQSYDIFILEILLYLHHTARNLRVVPVSWAHGQL